MSYVVLSIRTHQDKRSNNKKEKKNNGSILEQKKLYISFTGIRKFTRLVKGFVSLYIKRVFYELIKY